VQAGWPCTTCELVNDLDAAVCRACGKPFLSALTATGAAAAHLPLVGDLRAMSPTQRGVFGVVVGLVVLGLVAVLGLLVALLG
jgi:hypothetical protein